MLWLLREDELQQEIQHQEGLKNRKLLSRKNRIVKLVMFFSGRLKTSVYLTILYSKTDARFTLFKEVEENMRSETLCSTIELKLINFYWY